MPRCLSLFGNWVVAYSEIEQAFYSFECDTAQVKTIKMAGTNLTAIYNFKYNTDSFIATVDSHESNDAVLVYKLIDDSATVMSRIETKSKV